MILPRLKLFSSKSKKMTDKEFEEKENNIKSEYKKGLVHGTAAAINGLLAGGSIKEAIKTKGKSKLNLALAGLTTANTLNHAYKSGKHVKKAYKTGHDEVLDKERGSDPHEKSFSRHTPKNLKKYRELSDEDIDKMSKGQRLAALEEEDNTAAKNTNKYVIKKVKKHAGIGALGGAAIGAGMGAAGSPGQKVAGAVAGGFMGAMMGGTTGLLTGSARGQHIAEKEGHNRDKRTKKLARRMDERARAKGQDDDYEYRNNDRIRMRKSEEAARRAEANAAMASYNAAGARYGW